MAAEPDTDGAPSFDSGRLDPDLRLPAPVPLLLLLPLFVGLAILLIPISLVQRYRMATARRRARSWLINVNVAGLTLSAMLFVIGAGFSTIWIPHALSYSVAGLAAGGALGLVGLWLTRWEATPDGLYYRPNRWLVLAITLVVSARIIFGFWRALHTWRVGGMDESWLGAAGVADSMAAGALVLGYYLAYWIGVRRRHRRTPPAQRFTPRPLRAAGAGQSAAARARVPADHRRTPTRSS
jgi:hypothetical protein